MGYILLLMLVAWILYQIIPAIRDYVRSSPRRKLLLAERRWIKGILGEFNVREERAKVIRLLKENLPEEYQCHKRKRGWTICNGILLKQPASSLYGGDRYMCSECGNIRVRIRIGRKAK